MPKAKENAQQSKKKAKVKPSALEVILNDEEAIFQLGPRKFKLVPLNLWDIKDFERRGASILSFMGPGGLDKLQFSHASLLLWLSVRKSGLNDQQILNEEWLISEYELLSRLPLNVFKPLSDAVVTILTLSGLIEDTEEEEEGDPTGIPPSPSSQEKSSKSPGEASTTGSEGISGSPEQT
jgi:hypothetical protein